MGLQLSRVNIDNAIKGNQKNIVIDMYCFYVKDYYYYYLTILLTTINLEQSLQSAFNFKIHKRVEWTFEGFRELREVAEDSIYSVTGRRMGGFKLKSGI